MMVTVGFNPRFTATPNFRRGALVELSRSHLGGEFQSKDSGDDECHAHEAKRVTRFMEPEHPDQRTADCADASPHDVSRPDGDGLQRGRNEIKAQRAEGEPECRGPELCASLRILHGYEPGDFEQASDEQV